MVLLVLAVVVLFAVASLAVRSLQRLRSGDGACPDPLHEQPRPSSSVPPLTPLPNPSPLAAREHGRPAPTGPLANARPSAHWSNAVVHPAAPASRDWLGSPSEAADGARGAEVSAETEATWTRAEDIELLYRYSGGAALQDLALAMRREASQVARRLEVLLEGGAEPAVGIAKQDARDRAEHVLLTLVER